MWLIAITISHIFYISWFGCDDGWCVTWCRL